MKKKLVGTLAGLVAGAGAALAQSPQPAAPPQNLPQATGAAPLPAGPSNAIGSPLAAPLGCNQCACAPAPEAAGPQFWASGEYLLWWLKGAPTPALLSTGPAGSAGILDRSGTSVIFGGNNVDQGVHHGARFTGGLWLDDCHTWGVEGGYFFLASEADDHVFSSPGDPVLARPFFNVVTGRPDSELVSTPGTLAGTFTATTRSRFDGAELNALRSCWNDCESSFTVLVGFRYLHLDEGLRIREDLALASTVPGVGNSTFVVVDNFSTENRFYGGQVGGRFERRFGKLFANAQAKVALGGTEEVVNIRGATRSTQANGTAVTTNGGLLALPTNSGRFSHDAFSFVSDVNLNVGYQVTERVRASIGYDFLYWSDVARPGSQIDTAVNPTQLPSNFAQGTLVGPARPAFIHHDSDFWAQGLNFKLEFRY